MKKRIVIFASGSGSNALNLIQYYKANQMAEVLMVFCNKAEAGVLSKAQAEQVPTRVFNRHDFYETDRIIQEVSALSVDVVVLAGFLWLVPAAFIRAFEGKIINLHPSLLPKYGGKGMYGHHVHEAVLAAKETHTGITIHLVNEQFDQGEIVFQTAFPIQAGDGLAEVEAKIHALEHQYLPIVIDGFLNQ